MKLSSSLVAVLFVFMTVGTLMAHEGKGKISHGKDHPGTVLHDHHHYDEVNHHENHKQHQDAHHGNHHHAKEHHNSKPAPAMHHHHHHNSGMPHG